MALMAMASWVTDTNDRLWMLKETVASLARTVNFSRHRLFIIDNGSNAETRAYYKEASSLLPFTLIQLEENVGTARAINTAWLQRKPNEHALKVDSDVSIEQADWLDRLEDCVEVNPSIGIIGLKRPDCIETPWTEGWYKSELQMLPHVAGNRWLIIEKVNHVLGTIQLYNSKLLDKIGYLYQFGESYSFDDSLAAARCTAAGFFNCFYPHVLISHLDPGLGEYQTWKEETAQRLFPAYHKIIKEYANGTKSVYHGPFDD